MPSGLFDRVVVVCDVFDFGLEFVVGDVLVAWFWGLMISPCVSFDGFGWSSFGCVCVWCGFYDDVDT